MKYIYEIDSYTTRTFTNGESSSVIARPMEAFGLLKWEVRLRHAIACLSGKAVAVTFHKQ